MQSIYSESFDQKSSEKALDTTHRKKINFNIGKYNAVVPKGKMQFNDIEKVRSLAKNKKWEAVEHLDLYLTQFEEQITKRGAKVFWAEDSEQALDFIGSICKKKECKT